MKKNSSGTAFYQGPSSDHFDGRQFFNPWDGMKRKSFLDFLKWRFNGGRSVWPTIVENKQRTGIPATIEGTIRATFIGHATTLVQIDGMTILLDPVFSDRVSPFTRIGPKRVRKPFLELAALPKIDAVFVSHNHYDHMDAASLAWLATHHKPVFVTPLGNPRHLRPWVGDCPVIALDWHKTHIFENGVSLTVTPAQHWSRRALNDINRDLWGGCVIKSVQGKTLYYSGDSGFHQELFEDLAHRYNAPDIAILPIGAYEPRWFMRYFHMNPAEAVQVHRILNVRQSMGFHFETFQLTDEAFETPREDTLKALQEQGLETGSFLIPHPGDYLEV